VSVGRIDRGWLNGGLRGPVMVAERGAPYRAIGGGHESRFECATLSPEKSIRAARD